MLCTHYLAALIALSACVHCFPEAGNHADHHGDHHRSLKDTISLLSDDSRSKDADIQNSNLTGNRNETRMMMEDLKWAIKFLEEQAKLATSRVAERLHQSKRWAHWSSNEPAAAQPGCCG